MNIVWFVSSMETRGNVVASRVASVRIRCLEVSQALIRLHPGWQINLILLREPLEVEAAILDRADVVVFGKVFANWEGICQYLKQRDISIVIDVCEDIFNLTHLKEHYQTLLHYGDAVVVSCQSLSEVFLEKNHNNPHIIPDIQEGSQFEVSQLKYGSQKVLKLVWFGQSVNLEYLDPVIVELLELDIKISLIIVTDVDASVEDWFNKVQIQCHSAIQLQLVKWSLVRQLEAVRKSDIVIIPSAARVDCKVKTANRVMTSLWAGKPVVAYPLPSYQEFNQFMELNTSITMGITRLLSMDPQIVMERVQAGQKYIKKHYSPDVVSLQWSRLFQNIGKKKASQFTEEKIGLTSSSEPPRERSNSVIAAELVKLNLGCGDKILPGYINVDVVDERAGNKPDVICDVRQLIEFDDNYADEVMTVHVIEHFYYWEAREVLSEWVRVLKPGGKMVIECPNLITACEELLKNPKQATSPGSEGQRTMWVFYGDPAWKDPLMCHKWLYTSDSLSVLMRECGLDNVVQESAQYKLREPRDMRLVGYKA